MTVRRRSPAHADDLGVGQLRGKGAQYAGSDVAGCTGHHYAGRLGWHVDRRPFCRMVPATRRTGGQTVRGWAGIGHIIGE
ncbi:hypothetical protein MLIT_37120 [Mycolicibacterium litorale]|uniref:Uncharacterized protein n=1 Tax=Mycolicibacterium litorale TaxID=758802 RepID=A0AAD1MUW4_9MYCO|nr:hypothetical protein MLIT_37120 [Mycolicibacterium litorale]